MLKSIFERKAISMKKVLFIVLSAALMLLSGCKDDNGKAPVVTTVPTTQSPVTTTTEMTNTLESDISKVESDIVSGIDDMTDMDGDRLNGADNGIGADRPNSAN